MNHLDIVQRVKDANPIDTTSEAGILAFLLKVIGALPREERGGLLRKDSGDNIAWYPPRNCNVSISRVCYPDGHLYKVLSDVGAHPESTNGAAWDENGFVEVPRYLEIVSTQPIPDPEPVPQDALLKRVIGLESTVDRHATELTNLESAQIEDRLRIKELEDKPEPEPFELPALIVEGDTSRVFGHGHKIKLEVIRKK